MLFRSSLSPSPSLPLSPSASDGSFQQLLQLQDGPERSYSEIHHSQQQQREGELKQEQDLLQSDAAPTEGPCSQQSTELLDFFLSVFAHLATFFQSSELIALRFETRY